MFDESYLEHLNSLKYKRYCQFTHGSATTNVCRDFLLLITYDPNQRIITMIFRGDIRKDFKFGSEEGYIKAATELSVWFMNPKEERDEEC